MSPFVIESGGRPGTSARSILMQFAPGEEPTSVEVGNAWRELSCIIQSERALGNLTAWGGSKALTECKAEIFVP